MAEEGRDNKGRFGAGNNAAANSSGRTSNEVKKALRDMLDAVRHREVVSTDFSGKPIMVDTDQKDADGNVIQEVVMIDQEKSLRTRAEEVIWEALDKSTSIKERLRAAMDVYDRYYGRARQTLEVSGGRGDLLAAMIDEAEQRAATELGATPTEASHEDGESG